MKKLTLLIMPIFLAACASTTGISPQATMRLGKITEKQTSTQPVYQGNRLPIDVGFGFGGGGDHIGWGINMGLNQIFALSDSYRNETIYQYKVEVAKNDFLLIRSNQNLSPDQCVTVYELPNNGDYPKIAGNLDCKLPAAPIAAAPATIK
ncbi:hypothetical protein [Hydromonas duriensis]|uniref:Lipoprotein n=1 Tax=Hydromonas duriensis TaxID=1527608 RepID=A0A4R6Y8D3_9BURK|nr:hypothetical protein [Hydromonas duriensis]TDR31665.1 hypothetical protein DFR44_10848 [Hydromonas duriensis]